MYVGLGIASMGNIFRGELTVGDHLLPRHLLQSKDTRPLTEVLVDRSDHAGN